MAGLILKSPYYKPKSRDRKSGSRGGMVKYIGTREGVEMLRSEMVDYISSISPFPKLHLLHKVCRLSITVSPPFAQGTI